MVKSQIEIDPELNKKIMIHRYQKGYKNKEQTILKLLEQQIKKEEENPQ